MQWTISLEYSWNIPQLSDLIYWQSLDKSAHVFFFFVLLWLKSSCLYSKLSIKHPHNFFFFSSLASSHSTFSYFSSYQNPIWLLFESISDIRIEYTRLFWYFNFGFGVFFYFIFFSLFGIGCALHGIWHELVQIFDT